MTSWVDVVDRALPAITLVLGSAVTFYFTSKTTRRQLDHDERMEHLRGQDWVDQQWWQRKAQRYEEIIESLWAAYSQFRRLRTRYDGTVPFEVDFDPGWGDAANAWIQAEKLGTIGEFIISAEVEKALLEFSEKLNEAQENYSPDLAEVYLYHENDARECIQKVRIAALKDLRVSSTKPTSPPWPQAGLDSHLADA